MQKDHNADNVHTPVSLITLFANSFKLEKEQNLLRLKGIYQDRGRGSARGYYYDRLKDEMSGQIVTIRVPELMKRSLRHDHLYLFKGVLDKDVRYDGVIEPVFIAVELLAHLSDGSSGKSEVRAQIRQQKEQNGRKDIDSL